MGHYFMTFMVGTMLKIIAVLKGGNWCIKEEWKLDGHFSKRKGTVEICVYCNIENWFDRTKGSSSVRSIWKDGQRYSCRFLLCVEEIQIIKD